MKKFSYVIIFFVLSFQTSSSEFELIMNVVDDDNLLVTLMNNSGDPYETQEISNRLLCREPNGGLQFLLLSKNEEIFEESTHVNFQCAKSEKTYLPNNMGVSKIFNYSRIMHSSFNSGKNGQLIEPKNGIYRLQTKVCFSNKNIPPCLISNTLIFSIKNGELISQKIK
mgnify:CR=1 FL=1